MTTLQATTTDLSHDGVAEICSGAAAIAGRRVRVLRENQEFHWHMSGPHFRDYHLLLDEQGSRFSP